MTDLEMKLACLLASYEMDAPHVSSPDLDVGPEDKQFYPAVTPEKMEEWLATPHHGDCIKLPHPASGVLPRIGCTKPNGLQQNFMPRSSSGRT